MNGKGKSLTHIMPSYEIEYAIQGMDCANCALTLERSLAQLQGVERVQVNFTAAVLTASGTFDPQALVARVEAMGYRASPPETKAALPQPMDAETQPAVVGFLQFLLSERSTTMALVGGIGLLTIASIGVFERQREIGVMRSIGASSGAILIQFWLEGILVGLAALALAVTLALGSIVTFLAIVAGAAAPPANEFDSPVPLTAGPVRLAIGAHAQCAGRCADLANQEIAPDRILGAALDQAAALAGRPDGHNVGTASVRQGHFGRAGEMQRAQRAQGATRDVERRRRLPSVRVDGGWDGFHGGECVSRRTGSCHSERLRLSTVTSAAASRIGLLWCHPGASPRDPFRRLLGS